VSVVVKHLATMQRHGLRATLEVMDQADGLGARRGGIGTDAERSQIGEVFRQAQDGEIEALVKDFDRGVASPASILSVVEVEPCLDPAAVDG
jgi:hypothetical protein